MRELFIVGAGGLGREVAWTVARINAADSPRWKVVGFADDAAGLAGASVGDFSVLGTVAETAARFPDAAVALAIGSNAVRERLAAALAGRDFPALIDPSAIVAPTARIGRGSFVAPMALVSCDAEIGEFVIVNARAGIGHDARVGDFASVCPGVSLSGWTRIGKAATMGTNSSTVQMKSVGAGATVAAGVSVLADVPDGATLSPFGTFKSPRIMRM